ncbi:MAG: hypothetical protein GXO34_00320 [Deltaproteobacteria bacterium]|nr:hypothetical protein [Deltaproteobacteria bacterium]
MGKAIKILVVVVVLLGGAALIAASYYFGPVIEANQRGVVLTGSDDQADNLVVLSPGKHYWFISGYNPITSTLVKVDVNEKELPLAEGDDGLPLTDKNGDIVKVEFAAWWRVLPEKAGLSLAAVGEGNAEKMVRDLLVTTAREMAATQDADAFLDGTNQKNFVAGVKQEVNRQLAPRGLEVTVLKCNKFHFSDALKKKIEEIKKANDQIAINKIRVQAAAVAAQEMEELAKGRKRAALQEAEARKESAIMASEAQIVAARNWVEAEKIKAQIILVRSKIKAEAMQVEAQAKEVFAGPEGERFLRYRIADSLADAWAKSNGSGASENGIKGVAESVNELTRPEPETNLHPAAGK